MTPLPKKKHTKARSAARKRALSVSLLKNLIKCTGCGKYRNPHRSCPSCGKYK